MAAMRGGVGACPLVDRDLELRTMAAVAVEAAEDGVRMLVVTGEAGAGKSRLWVEFAADARPGVAAARDRGPPDGPVAAGSL